MPLVAILKGGKTLTTMRLDGETAGDNRGKAVLTSIRLQTLDSRLSQVDERTTCNKILVTCI